MHWLVQVNIPDIHHGENKFMYFVIITTTIENIAIISRSLSQTFSTQLPGRTIFFSEKKEKINVST